MSDRINLKLNDIVEQIELFRYDVDVPRHYSWGNWDSRQIGFIRIASGSHSGWGENRITSNDKNVDIVKWASCFAELKGRTITEALDIVADRLTVWGTLRCEMAEMALIDLAGKLRGIPAVDLLDITGTAPVPGLYCVLENEPEKAAAMATAVKAMQYTSHIKIKLYGKPDLDKNIITAVRHVMGGGTYIVGDVNCGYRVKKSADPLDEIAGKLLELHAAGLNACEDPADMTIGQWIELQKKVNTLDLIPDHIMRPAAAAVNTIVPGMGRIYNIHPGCMGSVIDAVRLAKKVKSFGAKLMIGDDSLIGPSLTAWQQVAIGMQAEWVEAVEKQGESEVFLERVRSQVTFRDAHGKMAMKKPEPGFGQDIDTNAVRSKAVASIVI